MVVFQYHVLISSGIEAQSGNVNINSSDKYV